MEGLFHHRGHVAHILDQEIVLDDGARDAHCVALLEGVLADGRRGHLAGDDHHRDRVHVGRGDAGDGIGHARARSDQSHAHVTGGARIAVGRVHGGLLVANQHVLNGFLLVKSVVDVQHRAAGVAPDVLHALGLQRLDQNFGAAQVLRGMGRIAARGWGGVAARRRCSGRFEFGFGDFHFVQPFENFSDEKPWVPLASPRGAASGLETTRHGRETVKPAGR